MPVGIISLIAFRLPRVVFEGKGIREKGPFRVRRLRAGHAPEGPRPGWYRGGAGAAQTRDSVPVNKDGEHRRGVG